MPFFTKTTGQHILGGMIGVGATEPASEAISGLANATEWAKFLLKAGLKTGFGALAIGMAELAPADTPSRRIGDGAAFAIPSTIILDLLNQISMQYTGSTLSALAYDEGLLTRAKIATTIAAWRSPAPASPTGGGALGGAEVPTIPTTPTEEIKFKGV